MPYKVGDRIRVVKTTRRYHSQTGTISFVRPSPPLDEMVKTQPGMEQLRVYEVTLDSEEKARFTGMEIEPERN